MKEIQIQSVTQEKTATGGKIHFKMDLKNGIRFRLLNMLDSDNQRLREAAQEIEAFLSDSIASLDIIKKTAKEITFTYKLTDESEAKQEEARQFFTKHKELILVTIGLLKADTPKRGSRLTGANYPLSDVVARGLTGTPLKGQVFGENRLPSAAMMKTEHILLSLLAEASKKDPKDPEYFTGNLGAIEMPITALNGGEISGATLPAPQMEVSLGDIFKAWAPGKKLGGSDKRQIVGILTEYSKQTFFWSFEIGTPSGQVLRAHSHEQRAKIVFVSLASPDETDKIRAGDVRAIEANQRIFLRFSPAFLSFKLEGGRYTNTRADLPQTLEAAAGGAKKVIPAHYDLYHYFNSLATSKKGESSLSHNEAMNKAGLSSYTKYGSGSKGRATLLKVFADLIKTGVLLGYTENRGIYYFQLPKAGG